jgi:urease accessory protein
MHVLAMRNTMLRRSVLRRLPLAALVAVAVTALSTDASAHVGDHSHASFVAGFWHPLSGLDHLLAMVAVGLWASQLGRPALWLLPLTFPAIMALGAAAGLGGAALPWVEIAIAGSVLTLGAAVALALRPSLAISIPLIALFALVHGYSHGAELPAGASALSYGAGFVAATLALHALGIAIGLAGQRVPLRFAARTAGGTIAVIGAVLFFVTL